MLAEILTVLGAAVASGVASYFAARHRFLGDAIKARQEYEHQVFLTNEANEHHKQAIALCDGYQERVDDKTAGYREAAEKAGKLAKQARRDYEAAIKTSREQAWEEARREFAMKIPEPCERCEGLGFYVGGNNQSYNCKHCEGDGEVIRVVKGKKA